MLNDGRVVFLLLLMCMYVIGLDLVLCTSCASSDRIHVLKRTTCTNFLHNSLMLNVNHNSCSELLESCQFSSFWPEFRKLGIPEYGSQPNTIISEDRKLLANAVNGSKCSNTIRENMLKLLGKVYKSAPVKNVLEALDLKDEAMLTSFASKIMVGSGDGEENVTCIVEKIENGFVVFASCVENSKRAGSAFKEGVGYADIARMMKESKVRGQ